MSRDLFEATVVARSKPKRARWIVIASALAHVGIIGLVLIGPILSATEGIVALARGVVYYVPATPAMPQAPASPPQTAAAAAAPDLNPQAAPTRPAESLAVQDVTSGSHPALPPHFRYGPGGNPNGIPGAPTGGPTVTLAPPEPPPITRPLEPVRIGGQIRAPLRTAYVAPVYPAVARTAKIEAEVTLEATIDEQGLVRNVRVVRPNALFDKAAMDAVGQWRYEPTRLNGHAVPVILTVTVRFEIRK